MREVILQVADGREIKKTAYIGPPKQWIHYESDVAGICKDESHWAIFKSEGEVKDGLPVLTQEN